ncbi:MAG: hypothetical protein GY820_40935, partial [Gammaproteobacteria bacterium]|nr:hypothetical protein [Gammaproteobacteria bacterium]
QNQQDLQKNQQKTDSKLENFRSLTKTQCFRLSYEGGQIPPKNGEHLQINSDMGHSKSRASLGMHDIACECSECLLEKIAKIAQAKPTENFQRDASKNNRPNNNCYESSQRFDSSEPIAVVKPIDESISVAIGQLREIFHSGLSKIEQEVEKVETNVRELSNVVDHYIMKRDQESETPVLNVFAAASNDLCTMGEGRVPDPLVKELPIRRLNMSRVTIEVEGKPIQFRVDADANPSLVVPERIAMQVLARKYGTLDK